ncbi:RDD family protein [Pseudorhodoplanes sp.]|uniref:RDD family protein n=1 Tax=Pseudorhodoplanes sp. TaxID=1934341 RepID=UPI00391BA980
MAEQRDRIGVGYDVRPHAFDPDTNPELFDGVPARRVLAFIIDLVILAIPLILVWIFFFAIGIVTLGLGFALFGLMPVIALIWAAFYYGTTLGGPRSATIGMRALAIEMRTWYGGPSYFVLAVVHAGLFWVTTSVLTPLVLLVCFFNTRKRLLHDFLIGTVVVNSGPRAGIHPPSGPGFGPV